ncbi:MAG: cytochrome c biogenesis CcdA family protein [Halobacteriaceae archaeon]
MTAPGVDLLGSVAFAFGAGVATFFSPCAYPLLPGYVGYYASRTAPDRDGAPVGGALVRGVAASAGTLAVFGVLLAAVATVGRAAVSNVALLEPVIGLALVALGAATLAGRTPSMSVALPERRASVAGFAAFGVVYAVAAAGCVLPVFAGVVLQALTLPLLGSVAVVGAYATGLVALLMGVTVVTALGVTVGTSVVRYVDAVVRAAGAVMVAAGLGQLYLSVAVLHVV